MKPCSLCFVCVLCLFCVLCFLQPGAATAADSLPATLQALAETPAVSGYEELLADLLAQRLARLEPQRDNLGNLWVVVGSGTPPFGEAQGKRRLLVTCVDEPGYVVSGITEDGYLRLQRLPQRALHPWFDLLHSAQPVAIWTRSSKLVPGVIAGLSTHIQPGRQSVAERRTDELERIYVDIGARSRAEVRALGVDLLDPLTLEKHAYALAHGEWTGPALSARFGAAALVALLERMDASRLRGTLIVAFATRHHIGSQGLDRLTQQLAADEVILLEPLSEASAPTESGPGSGVLIGTSARDAAGNLVAEGLAAALRDLAGARNIPAQVAFSSAHPRNPYTGGPALPARTAQLGLAVRFPLTPAEIVSANDLEHLVELLAAYAEVPLRSTAAEQREQANPSAPPGREAQAKAGSRPGTEEILRTLVETYGVSGFEEPVAEAVRRLLPEWARTGAVSDAEGNLMVTVGPASASPHLVFVAHTDEIGWTIDEITDDGRLVLRRRGGFLEEHFLGHSVFVHTSKGPVPAVLELPESYASERYTLVEGRPHTAYVGARTRAEAEALGLKVGDSLTVPKKYRRLGGRRANGRSFDDRVGSTALIAALWQLDPGKIQRRVTFLWAVEEEIGLRGALAVAPGLGADTVFAVDTFVSADSPLESKRFAYGVLGQGFVIRAVDSSNVAPRALVDRVIAIARRNKIPVQYGVTGGGNDGAAFVRHGAVDIPIGWPLRYSHSAGEVVDLADVEALARIVAALAREF